MNNLIKKWSWDRPTQEGDYLACYGDVETPENVVFLRLRFDLCGHLIGYDEHLNPFDKFGTSYKYAKLIYRPSEIKAVECE